MEQQQHVQAGNGISRGFGSFPSWFQLRSVTYAKIKMATG